MHKVGLIGCGGISESHRRGFESTGRAGIKCVWDIDPERASETAAKWGAKAASSPEALVQSDVNIIVIATPGFAHREYVEMAAGAGKHILCEKPIALNLDDAIAIRDAVLRSEVKFMAGFNPRYDPPLVQLRIGG